MNLKNKLIILVVLAVSSLFISSFAHAGMAFAVQPEDQWVAHPLNVSYFAGSSTVIGYTPTQIRTAYGLPSSGGAGTTIAIIDAYDTPSVNSDLAIFSNEFGLPAPNDSNFEIYKMPGTIGSDKGWGKETCLDVEWAHAIAPDAKILLVEAKSPNQNDLLSAVKYARSQPDVVSVSMSWGSNEYSTEKNYDSMFISGYGAVFFAASGDNGSSEVIWPATSPNVVAVGGTTLNLNHDGTVISETGWNGSGGGISAYENRPTYQTNYGITSINRAIPDVSYNADPHTGVAVYCNSLWYKIGGTSAGAPQWAAIQALGKSATNTNLYQKAKYSYASYFRDIITGSNGGFNATVDYDYVTGLGSPLT
ncbi:S53 family peptidase, partial [Candidatus Bathyarchaeota archaeon]|nr:S53 family peptidase [Candidatus Bathyarchaeota archaeon]